MQTCNVTDAEQSIVINDFMFTKYIVPKRRGRRVVTSGLFWIQYIWAAWYPSSNQGVITARIRWMGEGNSFSLLVCPHPGGGGVPILARSRQGVPQGRYPPPLAKVVTLPPPCPRTWYTAGGKPLAFTQEVFLVVGVVYLGSVVYKQ